MLLFCRPSNIVLFIVFDSTIRAWNETISIWFVCLVLSSFLCLKCSQFIWWDKRCWLVNVNCKWKTNELFNYNHCSITRIRAYVPVHVYLNHFDCKFFFFYLKNAKLVRNDEITKPFGCIECYLIDWVVVLLATYRNQNQKLKIEIESALKAGYRLVFMALLNWINWNRKLPGVDCILAKQSIFAVVRINSFILLFLHISHWSNWLEHRLTPVQICRSSIGYKRHVFG